MEETTQKEMPLDVEPEVVDTSAEKAALREKNKLKKRAQRARDKAARDAVKAAKAAKEFEASLETMTNAQWWARQRKELTEKQIAEYTAREAEVIDLELAMENVVFSRLDTYALHAARADRWDSFGDKAAYEKYRERLQRYQAEGLVEAIDLDLSEWQIQELEAKVNADVKQHGVLSNFDGVDFANPAFRHNFDHWFSDGAANRFYIMYGFTTAISGRLRVDFNRAVYPPSYGMRCQCGATTKVQDASEVVPRWRCQKCAERDRKQAEVNAQLDKIRQQAIREPDRVVPFDAFGRPFDG